MTSLPAVAGVKLQTRSPTLSCPVIFLALEHSPAKLWLEAPPNSCHQVEIIADRTQGFICRPRPVLGTKLSPLQPGQELCLGSLARSGTATRTHHSKNKSIDPNWLDPKWSSLKNRAGRQIGVLLWPCERKLNSIPAGSTASNALGCFVCFAGGKCFTLPGH